MLCWEKKKKFSLKIIKQFSFFSFLIHFVVINTQHLAAAHQIKYGKEFHFSMKTRVVNYRSTMSQRYLLLLQNVNVECINDDSTRNRTFFFENDKFYFELYCGNGNLSPVNSLSNFAQPIWGKVVSVSHENRFIFYSYKLYNWKYPAFLTSVLICFKAHT